MKISVVNQKGGVGKTTTAISLAWELANRGRHVLLVDADSQGSCSVALGIDDSPGLSDVLMGSRIPMRNIIRPTKTPGLDLAPCGDQLGIAQWAGTPRTDFDVDAEDLAKAVTGVESSYDAVIIDSPPNTTSVMAVCAVIAAPDYLVPVSCDVMSVRAMERGLSALERMLTAFEIRNARCIGIVPTMVDGRKTFTKVLAKQIRQKYPELAFNTDIRFSGLVTEAVEFGIPAGQADPSNTAVVSYRALLSELEDRLNRTVTTRRTA